MLQGLESGPGLDVVIWLQSHSTPWLNTLALLLHLAGGTLTYVIVLIPVYWSVERRLGLRLLATLASASFLTETLKALAGRPRPYQVAPDQVTALVMQEGFGLPSGHVLITLVVLGSLPWALGRGTSRLGRGLLIGYVLLMAWARMALGVHYPQDVMAGLVFGGGLVWLVARYGDSAVGWWAGQGTGARLGLVGAAALVAWFLTRGSEDGLRLAGMLFGGGLGLVWERRAIRFSAAGSRGQRVLRSVLGGVLIAGVYVALGILLEGAAPGGLWRIARYAIIGWIGMGLWPWVCVRIGLAGREAAEGSSLPESSI